MSRLLVLATTAVAASVLAIAPHPAQAADPSSPTAKSDRKRCADLVAFFDRWGATRTEHTDGARNVTRISANIDCERGDYGTGIRRMEALMTAKKFEIPVEVGEAPMYYPAGNPRWDSAER
jgi:hypothetical protein